MNDTNPAALPETGRPLTAREFFSLLPVGAPPYIPEVDDPDDEDTTALTPEREQEIRELTPLGAAFEASRVVSELLAELDRVRAERDAVRDGLDFLERATLPELRRTIQHHQDGKARWRKRAETAEARVAELDRPSEEARRREIRSSYTALIAQAEQDRDHEGACTLALQLRESEAKWAAEDAASLAEMQRANGNPTGSA